jgi:L-aspartate oxidase
LETVHPLEFDRHLVAFDDRHVPQYRFDVVVVGSGAAGGVAALSAAARGVTVALVAKAGLHDTNTQFAQGGMAAVLSPSDSFASHIADTLRVGCGLGEDAVVQEVVRGGPAAVEHLRELGAQFDKGSDGALALSREGGHTHARIIHAQGDATGLEIQRSVATALEQHPGITTFVNTFVVDLLSGQDGTVVGVLCRTERGDLVGFSARAVVLATGGAGQIYRETTNPAIATGDGIAMGFRAGATVRDLEFVQFHPTCLYIAGAARVLISEVVRGAGGALRDRHGVRFMQKYHPEGELAPRDVVSRAVFARMVSTGDTSVYLDLSQIGTDPHTLFPGISRICRFFGIDIAKDPIPVRPGAHYMVGGLAVDLDGRTSVPGLWAVGECASSGLHGANRMGSNSLLEAVVLGLRTGAAAAAYATEGPPATHGQVVCSEHGKAPARVQLNIEDLTYSLKSMMWRQMGVERNRAGLEDADSKLEFWTRAVSSLAPDQPRAWELRNMLLVARLATLAALAREESRGVHWRSDHPAIQPQWRAHTTFTPIGDGARVRAALLRSEPLPESVSVR